MPLISSLKESLVSKAVFFGQLASGGRAGTFCYGSAVNRGKTKRRNEKLLSANRDDALFSEHAVHIACSKWNGEKAAYEPMRQISTEDIDEICRAFDDFSRRWSKLCVGESITLEWADDHDIHRTNRRK